MKTQVLATSISKQTLQAQINSFFFSQYYIITEENKIYNTELKKYVDEKYSVIFKNNRWHFRRVIL